MNTTSLVSAIIPFLNAEQFIQESIESVLSQTYDKWELLLVDDGSTDRSTAIARHFVEEYPNKIRYLEHEGHQNRGTCASRNLGIRNSRGKYMAFLDVDDVWLAHKLEQQVSIMDSQPGAGMVYGKAIYWYGWTGKPEDIQRDYVDRTILAPDNLYESPTLILHNHPLVENAGAPCPSNFLLRKEIVDRVGGFEESFIGKYQFYEDQCFLCKVYLTSSVFIADRTWIKYRLHPTSCSAVVTTSGQDESVRLYFLNWLEKYLSAQSINDTRVWKALQKSLLPYRHPILYNITELPQGFLSKIEVLLSIARQAFPTPIRRWLKAQLLKTAR